MKKRFLVLGSNSFSGSNFINFLLKKNCKVIVLVCKKGTIKNKHVLELEFPNFKKYFIYASLNLCLFLPINFKPTNLFIWTTKINYPIKFVYFENEILRAFEVRKYLFKKRICPKQLLHSFLLTI